MQMSVKNDLMSLLKENGIDERGHFTGEVRDVL